MRSLAGLALLFARVFPVSGERVVDESVGKDPSGWGHRVDPLRGLAGGIVLCLLFLLGISRRTPMLLSWSREALEGVLILRR